MQKLVNRKGFTLVELVVVIAVLAILAGVGVVAYNGYIDYANKGVDRATVGEINHALELANYSDPSIFDSPVTVYLADNGIICADPEVKSALEDAFGDLSATKLTYLKWKGALPADQLNSIATKLGTTGSMVDKYWENGYSASFAGNIEELWDDVYSMIDLYGGITGDTTNLSKLVNGLTDTTNQYNGQTYRDVMLNAWTSSVDDSAFKTFNDMCTDTTFKNNVGTNGILLSMAVARSCAFKAYAEKLDLSAEARAELEKWNPVPTETGGTYAHYESYFEAASSVQAEWKTIIESYQKNGQAEADATAFLGMLEAGKAVEDDLLAQGKSITDKDYYDALTGYVGLTETIMESRENWEAIQASMADSQSALYATVTSKNGNLNIDWHGKELDEFDVTSDAGAAGGTEVCNLAHTDSVELTINFVASNVTINKSVETIELCSKGGPTGIAITSKLDPSIASNSALATLLTSVKIASDNDCVTVSGTGASIQITVNHAGNATLTITAGMSTLIKTETIQVNVH